MAVFVDYYQFLSLEPEWDTDRLRKALNDAFRGNQGRINTATREKREEIEQRQALIPKARKILLNSDSKAKYDLKLADWKRTTPPPVPAAPTLQELWQLIDDGRYLDAVEGGKKLVQQTPNDYLAWEVYARANYYRKEYRTAVNAAEQAIRCNPQKAELYADAGEYLAANEQWDKAVLQLNRAIQLEPNNSGYKLNLANIYIDHEVWGDAEALLKGVLSQEPSNSTAKYFMAVVIHDRASERISEVVELSNAGKQGEARKILKEVQQNFDDAQKLVSDNSEFSEFLGDKSIQVRRWLGVNFYYRLFGFTLDGILAFPGLVLMAIDGGTNQLAVILGCIVSCGIWGYSWVWLAHKNSGQDLIKRLLGMQIVSDDQILPSLNQLITRAIIKPFNFFLAYLVFGLIIVFSMFGHLGQMGSGVSAAIGMTIGMLLIGLRIFWDLFFVTSKEMMPTFFGSALFMHEKIARTTVVAANKNDVMNFDKYHWF